eukprot:1578323-Rhodomonas_salina.1
MLWLAQSTCGSVHRRADDAMPKAVCAHAVFRRWAHTVYGCWAYTRCAWTLTARATRWSVCRDHGGAVESLVDAAVAARDRSCAPRSGQAEKRDRLAETDSDRTDASGGDGERQDRSEDESREGV